MQNLNRRISVSMTKTINIGNYESIKLHAGLSIDIADTADLDDEYNDAFDEVTKQVVTFEDEILGGEK